MAKESGTQALLRERPRFSAEDARRFVHELYGIEGIVTELPSERDQNFKVGEYILKIASAAELKAVLEFQNEAMALFGEPRVVPSKDGELVAKVGAHFVRLVTFIPGIPLADYRPHTPELLHRIGHRMGRLDAALQDLSHPAADRELYWNIRNASQIITTYKDLIASDHQRRLVDYFLTAWNQHAVPLLSSLRTSVIHNDANDYNIIVEESGRIGIIDFGDMVSSYTVAEPAIAAAYAMLSKADPIAAATHVIGGYHQTHPLAVNELAVIFPFICARLCMSVTIAAHQKKLEPQNEYLSISETPAWELLEKLRDVNPRLAHYFFREACGMSPCPATAGIVAFLQETVCSPVVAADLHGKDAVVLDLSISSQELGPPEHMADPARATEHLFALLKAKGATVGIGRYAEPRGVYTSELFRTEGNDGPEWRTVHLGVDLFMTAGSPVFAPLDGFVHSFKNNTALLDYGPTIILRHPLPGGDEFYTLYGHLSPDSLDPLTIGMPVRRGSRIASIGNFPDNGNWAPHLHFQIISDMLDRDGEFPGVAAPAKRGVWLSLSPDANLILGIPASQFPKREQMPAETLAGRRRYLGRSLSLAYSSPLKILRGYKQYLYDDTGRAYLDCVNNVAHVGHSHPRVVRAAAAQMAVLNTNTRYLHDNIVEYARRLCAKLPSELSVCFFVNSGSEANDLALRLARAHIKSNQTIVTDGAYHGNLTSLIEISPYKFNGPGGCGQPSHVQTVSLRAEEFEDAVRGPSTFIVESILSCAGQVVLPDNYLAQTFHQVRSAGGICIVDEVQTGFGRVGSHFWAFETQRVLPDIVTMGKSIGNGHPLGAVVTTPEIAASFNNGMEYFNTFGGNPVSCAAGLAVLDVIEEEALQQNALETGTYLKHRLHQLASEHDEIIDVRGLGLLLGIEFRTPASCSHIVERLKTRGILLSIDGPLRNVIKIKPPMVFSTHNADLLVETLADVLMDTAIRRRLK